MREILFRGKRADNGQWVQGDLVHDAFDGTSKNIAIGIRNKNTYPIEVIPETVGQFTGLLDKNRVKIFEGDINSDNGIVEFNQSDASFVWHYQGIEVMSMGGESEWCEITGNIYEN